MDANSGMDAVRLQRILRQNLEGLLLLGVDAVPARLSAVNLNLDESATTGESAAAAPYSPGARPPTTPHARTPRQAQPAPKPAPSNSSSNAAPLTSPASRPAAPPYDATLNRDTKLTVLQTLDRDEVQSCTKCGLHQGRQQTVFGEGDPDAALMFVGEGPGQTEDEMGRPFVGKAGELLDKMIGAMGFQRADVYIANTVKCRPPNNRNPTPDEVDACANYLQRQIATVQPRALVALGAPAARFLLNTTTGITRLRGIWQQYDGLTASGGPPIPVMPTFHPAYVLRRYDRDTRGKVWADLQKVMDLLEAEA